MNKKRKSVNSILLRLKNPGTIMAITGGLLLIAGELGFIIDNDKVNNIMSTICYILISMGVLNDSTTGGMYIPFVNDKYLKEKTEDEI